MVEFRRFSASIALLFLAAALVRGGLGAVSEERKGRSLVRSEEKEDSSYRDRGFLTQKRLGGPGSSPPTCHQRCGRCYPCRPVHVAIEPCRSTPLAYYPEAWRCQCGNQLFMP